MYAMHYDIPLPADHDMGAIRARVAEKGPLLDELPGLGIKAYLIRERGVDGSPVNQYAPFYLWRDSAGMGRFLWGGGGFGAIVDSFGRPPVSHWTGARFVAGSAQEERAVSAVRAIDSLSPDGDPKPFVRDAQSQIMETIDCPGLMAAALAVDPSNWRLLRFSLWAGEAPEDLEGTRYRVLHLSRPGFNSLKNREET
ncbi:MAG: DUF4865 family protein [Rhodospirillum sp.]|nr:DUF4865 family protein [Rhodospirillum sp.]MCF8487874.1 DUF4865 family protein [Rhodospirillum sp.]MCF8499196.1 DUF4865 family protein [Rhodospirillum sp.]